MDQLVDQLGQKDCPQNIQQMQSILNKLLVFVAEEQYAPSQLSCLSRLLPSYHTLVKKVAHILVRRKLILYRDLQYLVVNSLQKDCSDLNPSVRSSALNTLATLPGFSEHSVKVIEELMLDSNPRVRRVAMTSCYYLHTHSPNLLAETGLLENLYEMIRDSDPVVSATSLEVLEQVLMNEGGVIITYKLGKYILERLTDYSECHLLSVLPLLQRWSSRGEDDILKTLNLTDKLLVHSNPSIIITCVKLLSHLTVDYPHLMSDVWLRCQDQLVNVLVCSESPEMKMCVLELLVEFSQFTHLFKRDYLVFLPTEMDPLYLQLHKLLVSPLLCDETNAGIIVSQLAAWFSHPSLSKSIIKCLCEILQRVPECKHSVTAIFGTFLNSKNVRNMTDILSAFQYISLDDTNPADLSLINLLPEALQLMDIATLDGESQVSILWLLGKYATHIPQAPYLLHRATRNQEDISPEAHHMLLLSALNLFFVRAPECQDLMGHVLELCVTKGNPNVSAKAVMYYTLLQDDIDLCRKLSVF